MSKNNRKKNLYVPDEEIMLYNKSKNAETDLDEKATTEEATAEETVIEIENKAIVEEACVKNEDSVTVDTSVEDTQPENKTESKPQEKLSFKEKLIKFFTKTLPKLIPSKKDDIKTIIIKSISIVAALSIIVSCVYLVIYFADLNVSDSKIENIRNNYELNRDDYTKNDNNQFSKFDILKAENSDLIGWITIDNTEVNNPIYQTDNNDFYVKHSADKKTDNYGALFLDFRCNINPMSLSQNQIIYGHNMRFGAMFGTLDLYRDLEFYKKSPIIKFDSLYEKRVYKIFAVMVVNDGEDDTFGYTYTAYRPKFTNDLDFMKWIDYSRQRSLFDTTVDVNAQDEIITLSTCCYDYDNARFVILGRLVRDGESEEVNTADAAINKDVIYSKKYYDKKKLPIPQLPTSSKATDTSSTASK